jgi:hypothetical protein
MAFVTNPLGKRSNGSQYKLVASGVVTAAELGAASDDVAIFPLPGGIVVTDIHTITETAFDGTTPTVTVEALNPETGADLSPAVVLDSAVSVATGGARTSAALTNAQIDVPSVVTVKNNAADSTVGQVRVEVEYYVVGRSNENEG